MCCFSPSIFKDWLCPSINDLTIRLRTTGIICALLSMRITITTVVTTLTLKKFTPYDCNPNIILRTFMHHLSILEQDCKLQTYIMHRFFMSLPDRLAFFVRADRLNKVSAGFWISSVWCCMWLSRIWLSSNDATHRYHRDVYYYAIGCCYFPGLPWQPHQEDRDSFHSGKLPSCQLFENIDINYTQEI